jgi:pimeloyl-ACP methyl ester carboxylesterase
VLKVIERGSGPSVVLIHGAGPDAEQWGEVIDDLAADHRVVAYNRRGYPESGEPVTNWVPHIEDAIGLIEDRGLAPATVVGHSAGTVVAFGVAARQPELVRRLVAFDPILHAQRRPTFTLIRTVLKVQRLRKRDPEAAVEVFFRWATAYSDGSGSAFERMAPADQAVMRSRHQAVFADMDAGDGSKEIKRSDLDTIQNATIALGELSDSWFSKNVRALGTRLPNATVLTVERSGHAVSLDNPRRVAEIVRAA